MMKRFLAAASAAALLALAAPMTTASAATSCVKPHASVEWVVQPDGQPLYGTVVQVHHNEGTATVAWTGSTMTGWPVPTWEIIATSDVPISDLVCV